jgi:hypothetical protein
MLAIPFLKHAVPVEAVIGGGGPNLILGGGSSSDNASIWAKIDTKALMEMMMRQHRILEDELVAAGRLK